MAGDLLQQAVLRRWGGLFNAASILLYFGKIAFTVRAARHGGESGP